MQKLAELAAARRAVACVSNSGHAWHVWTKHSVPKPASWLLVTSQQRLQSAPFHLRCLLSPRPARLLQYSGTLRLGEGTPSLDAETPVEERLPWEHITGASHRW